jgi:hypothetical protein
VDEQQHASIPLGRVRAGELRWEKFLYEFKAGLRAAALGRQRHDRNWGTALTLHPDQGGSSTGQAMSCSPPEEVHAMTSQGTAARMPRWGRLTTRARPGPG